METLLSALVPSGNSSMQTLFSYMKSISPEDKIRLYDLLGENSEEDLRYLLRALDEKQLTPEYRLHKILVLYIPPILFVFGIFGNICSFLIMRQKSMSRQSTCIFLAALSVTDSLVLFIGLFRKWLGKMSGFDIRDQANCLCKLIVIVLYISSNISVWIIVAVTIERFIVVWYPLKAQRFCQVQRAKKIIGGLFLVFLTINIHFAWTVGLNETDNEGSLVSRCNALEGYGFLVSDVWPWVDALIYSFVPFITITIFNLLIICKLARASTRRGTLQKDCQQLRPRCNNDTSVRTTVMLLAVSFTLMLTTFPMNVTVIASVFWNREGRDESEISIHQLMFAITELLMYLNHSINFFLYCATGQKFRNEVIRMCCGKTINSMSTVDQCQHVNCSRKKSPKGCVEISKIVNETEL